MMKNKIFIKSLSLISVIGAISPIAYLSTSCNKGNPNIVIKQNENIDVSLEASEVKVGEDLVINFKLTDNYSLDFENSRITFPEANFDIYLVECKIDTDNFKITVPAELVTFNKVIIDIKAAACVVNTLTQDEYNAARNYFLEEQERKYQINGYIVPTENPEVGTEYLSYLANGKDDAFLRTYYKKESGEIKTINEKFFGKAEKDSLEDAYPGYTSIYSENGTNYIGIPCVTTYQRKQMVEFAANYFPTFDKVTANKVLDAFVLPASGKDGIKYIKFNANKKVSYFKGQIFTTSLANYAFAATYEDEAIPFETYTKRTDCYCGYDNWSKQTRELTSTQSVQCKHALFSAKLEGIWSQDKPIYIEFTNQTQMPSAPRDISIYLNGQKISPGGSQGQYIVQGRALKIISGKFKFYDNTIIVCIGTSPIFDEQASTSQVRIYQEAE